MVSQMAQTINLVPCIKKKRKALGASEIIKTANEKHLPFPQNSKEQGVFQADKKNKNQLANSSGEDCQPSSCLQR